MSWRRMVSNCQLPRTGSTNSTLRNVVKSEFNSFLWLSKHLEDFQRKFVRPSNESLLWLITEVCSRRGCRYYLQYVISVSLCYGNRGVSIMLLARDARLLTHMKREQIFEYLIQKLRGQSASRSVLSMSGDNLY